MGLGPNKGPGAHGPVNKEPRAHGPMRPGGSKNAFLKTFWKRNPEKWTPRASKIYIFENISGTNGTGKIGIGTGIIGMGPSSVRPLLNQAWMDLNYVGLRPPCVILGWAPEGTQPKITLNVGLRPPFTPAARFPAPRSLLLVQARRARLVRGEDTVAKQAEARQASQASNGWYIKPSVPSPGGLRLFSSQKNSNAAKSGHADLVKFGQILIIL